MKKVIHIPNKYLLLIDDSAQTEVQDGGWCFELQDEYASDKIRFSDEFNSAKSWFLRELNMAYLRKAPQEFMFYRKIDGSVKAVLAHLPLNGSPVLEGVDLLPEFYKPSASPIPGFVSFEQAEALKALGYNEPSIAYYTHNGRFSRYGSMNTTVDFDLCTTKDLHNTYSLAPMISEVFKWFHKKGCFQTINKVTERENWIVALCILTKEKCGYTRIEHIFDSEDLVTTICINKLIDWEKNGFPVDEIKFED